MIELDMELPHGALLPRAMSPTDPGGIVFDAADLDLDGGPVWPSRDGTKNARPAAPNQGHSRLAGARPLLSLRAGINGGFAAEAMLNGSKASLAIIFTAPDGPAGTLATLTPREGKDYIFLAARDGQAELQQRASNLALTQPFEPKRGELSLLCFSVDGEVLKLAQQGDAPSVMRDEVVLEDQAFDLFIGCRSDRKGLVKTLGAAQIARVILWPGEDIFEDNGGAAYAALKTQWQKDFRYGI